MRKLTYAPLKPFALAIGLLVAQGAEGGTVTFSGRDWTTLEQTTPIGGQYAPPQNNSYVTPSANTGLMTGRFSIDTAMTTPVMLHVGDKVSYDYFLSEESRNFRGTGASTYVGDSRTGFQDGSGNWVSGRVATYGSRWEQYFEGNNPQSVFHARGYPWSIRVEWTFNSATSAQVTLTLQGETVPFATWSDTFSDIANIAQFRVGLWDSEQDVTLANFVITPPAAGTTLNFDTLPLGQANNAQVDQSFGDNAAASSAGVTVVSNGTPNIALSWRAFGGNGVPRWDYYIDSIWTAAQLNDAAVGNYYDLVFTPRGSTKVLINSFNFVGYYGDANERFTFGMEIWDGGTLVTNWNETFTSGVKHPVVVNVTGETGHELVLSFNRVSSALSGSEFEGDGANIAVDDISFAEIGVAELSGPNSNEYAKQVLHDGPLAYYRLSETSAPSDYAANSGTLGPAANGRHTFGVIHPLPGALAGTTDGAARYGFDNGGNGRPTLIANNAALNTSVFTVEAWVKPTMEGLANAGAPLMNRVSDDGAGGRQGWVFFQRAANGQTPPDGNGAGFNFRMYKAGSTSLAIGITGGSYNVNEWTHLAATFDGTIARLYVNGVEATSGTADGTYAPNTLQSLAIGSYAEINGGGPGYQNPYTGLVDEVALYPGVLSQAQLLEHYQNGTNASRSISYETLIASHNPAGYYRLNEGTVAINSGTLGAAANGTYLHTANGVLGPQPPSFAGLEITNRATGFDGYSSYINLGNPPGLNFSGAISLEAWAKPATVQGSFADIIAHGVNPAGNAEVMLRITDNNQYALGSWDGATHGTGFAVPNEDKAGTNWVHLVGTYDGANWNLYRNGILVGTAADATGAFPVNDADWAIGASGDAGFVNGFRGYDGGIDEVAIYNYALSSSQVLAHYATGSSGPLLTISRSGSDVILTWPIGTLQEADEVTGTYNDLTGITSPHTTPASGVKKFYRVKY